MHRFFNKWIVEIRPIQEKNICKETFYFKDNNETWEKCESLTQFLIFLLQCLQVFGGGHNLFPTLCQSLVNVKVLLFCRRRQERERGVCHRTRNTDTQRNNGQQVLEVTLKLRLQSWTWFPCEYICYLSKAWTHFLMQCCLLTFSIFYIKET